MLHVASVIIAVLRVIARPNPAEGRDSWVRHPNEMELRHFGDLDNPYSWWWRVARLLDFEVQDYPTVLDDATVQSVVFDSSSDVFLDNGP
jgi:hypothetical protein